MTASLADWKGVPAPSATLLDGRFIRLEKLDVRVQLNLDEVWRINNLTNFSEILSL